MTGVTFLLEQLGEYVVTWTWQSAVVILLACVVARLDRRNSPSLRCRLWSVALISVLLLPWAPRVIASLSWTQELKRSWRTSNESLLQPLIINDSASMLPAEVSVDGETGSTPIVQRAATTLLQLAGLGWVLGVAFAAIRRLRTHTALRRIVKRGARVSPAVLTDTSDWPPRRTPSVVLSPQIAAPMLYGWFDPVILLPQDV